MFMLSARGYAHSCCDKCSLFTTEPALTMNCVQSFLTTPGEVIFVNGPKWSALASINNPVDRGLGRKCCLRLRTVDASQPLLSLVTFPLVWHGWMWMWRWRWRWKSDHGMLIDSQGSPVLAAESKFARLPTGLP